MPAQQAQFDALNTEHLQADLRGRSVRGGLLTLTSQGSKFVIQTVATVVLARLLTPADFGLVEMVVAITGLGQAFADLGLSEAIIQREKINHVEISALFWINVAIGLVFTLITMALAPVLVWFYRTPGLKDITLVLSFTFLIGGLRVQHDALLKRQMRFLAIAIRDVTSYAVAVPVAVVIAWRGGGYWALVALPLTMNAVQALLSWLMVRWVPGPPRRNSHVGSMVAFGGHVASSYLMANVSRRVDKVLVGWWWGAGMLGLYSRAYSLLMLPVQQLSVPVGSVIVPAFSRIQNDPERFARYYLRAANLIMWIIAPIFGFLCVAAEPVILLTLGRQWTGAAPVFQILAISALGIPLVQITVWTLVSRGESRRLVKLLAITSPIIITSYALGLPFGIKGVALSSAIVQVAILPWMLNFTFRGTSLTLRRLWGAIACPISMSLVGACLAELALRLTAPQHIIPQLLVPGIVSAATYLLSALIPSVRREFASFRKLFTDLRMPAQPVLPPA